jgi:endonuclease YncB( thermonuclease family)
VNRIRTGALTLTLALAILATGARAASLTGFADVIEGDRIEIVGQPVRLLEIDAPEAEQLCQDAAGADYRCGERAALALAGFLRQHSVACEWAVMDRDGAKLGRCTVAGRDAGEWLIEQGWALPDRACKCETYRDAAERAKSRGLGLWAGKFEPPWEWRKRQ